MVVPVNSFPLLRATLHLDASNAIESLLLVVSFHVFKELHLVDESLILRGLGLLALMAVPGELLPHVIFGQLTSLSTVDEVL